MIRKWSSADQILGGLFAVELHDLEPEAVGDVGDLGGPVDEQANGPRRDGAVQR